jgi:signal transduction histidine kinase
MRAAAAELWYHALKVTMNGLMADHIAEYNKLVAQNRALVAEVKRRVDQLDAINTVAATVSQSLDLDVVLEIALSAVLKVVHVEAAGISLIEEETGELVLRAQRGWSQDFVNMPMRIPGGQGISGQVIAEDDVVVTGNLAGDERLAFPAFGDEPILAQALAPMHARGKVIGILSVMSYSPYQFQEEEIAVLRAVADQVGVAIDNARLFETTRQQESRLSAILNSVADAIIAVDNRGRINLINHAAAVLFDIDAKAILGVPLCEAPLPPRLLAGLRRAMAHQRAQTVTLFDVQMENDQCWSVSVLPVLGEGEAGEESGGRVVVLQNVSHLREAELIRTRFIQTAAHDLRNPMGVTLSALAMLQGMCADDSEANEVIEIALNGIYRMQDLINDLLNLESITSGVGIQRASVSIAEVIDKVTTDMGPSFQEKAQELQISVAPDLPTIVGDAKWLYRALLNYLNNAYKYTPNGGQITVRAYPQEGELVIEVEDNGYGIPSEAQSHLFERFYRVVVAEDQPKGTGLGLAIVKSIAEQHGGRVFAHSSHGTGSTFGIILPIPAAEQG